MVATPYARKLAADAGVDISQASGSGPGGRVVAQDVQQLIESGGGEAPSTYADAPSAADGATDVSAHLALCSLLHPRLASVPQQLIRCGGSTRLE